MATNIGAKIELAGEREFRRAISEINTGLRVTASELALVTAKYSDNAKSVEALSAKNVVLENRVAGQTEKIAKLREALEAAALRYGETDVKTLRWQESLNKAEAELIRMEKELEDNSEALQKATKDMEKFETAEDEVAESTSTVGDKIADFAGKLGINLPAGADKAIRSLDKAKLSTTALMGAVTGIAVMFGKLTIETAKAADEILTLAQTTGLTTDQIQELNYASELLDVSTETITGSMTKMIRNMNNARMGSKQAEEGFRALRIRIKENNGQLRDAETIFGEVIDKLGKIQNETERDAIAMQIFGRSARELNPLIEAGSGALKEFAEQAHEMGYVMSGDTLEAFGRLDDAMQLWDNQVKTLKNNIAMVLLPILTALFEFLNKIDPKIIATVAILGSVVAAAISIAKAIKSINDALGIFKPVTDAAGVATGKMNSTFLKTVGIIMMVTVGLAALAAIIAVITGKTGDLERAMNSVGSSVTNMNASVSDSMLRAQRGIGYNAKGTSNWRGGLTWVGEEGPELVSLPAGTRIYNNRESMAMLRDAQAKSETNYYYISIDAKNVKEFNDVVRMAKGAKQARRAGMVMA